MSAPPTVDEMRRASQAGALAWDEADGNAEAVCPACGVLPPTLTVALNGAGPNPRCTTGCPPVAIERAYRALLAEPAEQKEDDPLEVIGDILDKLILDVPGIPPLPAVTRITDARGRRLTIHFADGRELNLGSTSSALNQSYVRAAVATQFGVVLRRVGQKAGDTHNAFDGLMAHVIAAAEQVDDDDAIARVEEWLAGFIHDATRLRVIDLDQPATLVEPLQSKRGHVGQAVRDTVGRLYVYGPELLKQINRDAGDHINREELGQHLAAAGFEHHRLRVKHEGRNLEALMWRSIRPWATGAGS